MLRPVVELRPHATSVAKSQYHLAVAGGCEVFLCVTSAELCDSVVLNRPRLPNHRDTENAEDAQRKVSHPPATARLY
jgi:hypothetical protein